MPDAEAGTATGYKIIKEDLIGKYPDRPEDYDLQRMLIVRRVQRRSNEKALKAAKMDKKVFKIKGEVRTSTD